MKLSKLIQMMFLGMGLLGMGVVEDTGGGATGDETGEADAAAAEAAAVAAAKTGGSGISDSEAKLLKEVMDKKKALQKSHDEATALKAKLAQFDGIDPDAVKALLKKEKDAETASLEAKGEWDRLKAQMNEEHGKDKNAIAAQLTASQAESAILRSTIAELTVGNAFAQSTFIRDELALTPSKSRVIYGGHFEFKDGAVIAYDKPTGASERTPLVDAKGDPLSFELALKKIVDADPDKEQLLKSKMKQGAGSKTAPNTKTPSQQETSQIKGANRIAAALTKNGLK